MKRVSRVSKENAWKVELRSMILDLTFNIVMTMLAGKRYYGEDRMKTLSKNMDLFLQRLIEEHRADRDRNTMVNHLLALQETQPQYYTDSIIKGLIL
ncbi:hypothetical protein OIU76_002111, partial [Salix suchowensis]